MTNKKQTLAILDSDCFLFFAGWEYREQCNKLGELGAKKKLDKLIKNVLDATNADYYVGFFSKHNTKNFRHTLATTRPYKGSRTSPPWQNYFKPILKKHYEDKWNLIPMEHIEADDAVVIAHYQFKDEYNIIHVGEDKDMLQLGEFKRLNIRSKRIESFEHWSGRRFFYSQLLHGDTADDIMGIPGIGAGNGKHPEITSIMKKRGQKSRNKYVMALWDMIDPTEEEMYEYVRDQYIRIYEEDALNKMSENYALLNMLKTPRFDYPKEIKLEKINKINKYSPKNLIDI